MILESHNQTAATTAFFIGLSACLGLPGELAQRLGEGETILGPAGMLCRVHTQGQPGELMAFPEVILPLAARELGGEEVVMLLSLQEQLLTEYGWRLTLSDLGLLCVCPCCWCARLKRWPLHWTAGRWLPVSCWTRWRRRSIRRRRWHHETLRRYRGRFQ